MAIDLFLEAHLFDWHIATVAEAGHPGLSVGGLDDFRKSLDDSPNPVGDFFTTTQLEPLNKGAGIADERWDEPLTPATRFEKACAAIRTNRIFANSPEAADEAITIAEKMLDEERAAILAAAAA